MMIRRIINKIRRIRWRKKFKHITPTSNVDLGVVVYNPDNLVMEEHTGIYSGATIMNTRAKFILKRYSGSAIGLTVITGNHMSVVGKWYHQITDEVKDALDTAKEYDKDVIVEEDVWIGANVTLLAGAHINRGAIVGAFSVVRSAVPPYAIVVGNPAKIIGFRFTPAEIIQHELQLYDEGDRLEYDYLKKNFTKYFTKRIKDINNHIKL